MSIIVDKDTIVLVQGITGKEGSFHAEKCLEYGTNIVGGVTPGKGGTKVLGDLEVYENMKNAVKETNANTSLIFVPPAFSPDAIFEAVDAGIKTIVVIAEGIPVSDTLRVIRDIRLKEDVRLIGPNCHGLISPGHKCKVGIMPGNIHKPGRVGIVSRSGTLTYEAVAQLTELGIGQSTCIGIGGDPVVGTSFVDVLELFNNDPETDSIVMIGEIGGTKEQDAADYIKNHFNKPVAALIVGKSAPANRRMGHAGAIITGKSGSASEKIRALKSAGCSIVNSPAQIGATVSELANG